MRLYPYELIVSQRSHVLILSHWGFGTQHMNIVELLSWLTLCHPLDFSIPISSVLQYLLEFAQIHVHWVGDANHLILCCPFLFLPSIFPSIRVFSSESALPVRWPKYQSFTASASILPMNTQDWSPLGWTGWISLQSRGLSRVFSNTTTQMQWFFGAQPYLWSSSHVCTWLMEKP